MEIILSSRNSNKAKQIEAIFAGTAISVLTLEEAGIEGQGVEDGDTLEHNGMQKAMFAWERAGGKWCMSDDSGLFIEALGGRPGVHAATWAGEVSTEEIMQFTLHQLEGVENRRSTFKIVATLISPTGEVKTFRGETPGSLLKSPRMAPTRGFPYSPIFVPDGQSKSFAEMTTEEANAVSHRGKAFKQVRDYLLATLNS
jgi:XTP/dITP diphosphohydrolase